MIKKNKYMYYNKKRKGVVLLQIIELMIHLFTFFIIFYDELLPKKIADSIYDFGLLKLVFIVVSLLVTAYVVIGLKEKEYLFKKFNRDHLLYALPVCATGVVLCVFMVYKAMK